MNVLTFYPASLCPRCATGLKELRFQGLRFQIIRFQKNLASRELPFLRYRKRSAEMRKNMNNMNQWSGKCSQDCRANTGMNMNDRRCRNNMNNNSCGRKTPSMQPMPMPQASCGCNTCNCVDDATSIQNDPLRGMPVGIGYVPWQQWDCVYNIDEGLSKGTIFPCLDLPFYGCIPRGFHCSKGGR